MADVVEFLLSGFTDNSGQPLNGGKVYTYQAGTVTPKSVYVDNLGATPEQNPVILDSNGRKQVYATGSYKFVVKTSAEVDLYTFDNLFFGEGAGTATFLGTTAGSSNTYTAAPTPAIASYVDGAMFLFQADKTNSGAATLNISTLGAKTLSSIVGQIQSGQTYLVRYRSATNSFEVVNNDPGYATTQAEIVALNTAGSPVVIRQSITMTGTLTIDVPLTMEKGGVLVTGSNVLTINGSFKCGLYQCFTTTATKVLFGRGSTEKVYPQWFGATGDGVTDDTVALQAAISSVEGEPRKATVYIPSGTYVTTGLTITKGITIEGSGWTTILSNSSAVNHTFYRAPSADTSTIALKISDLALIFTGGGSAVDGIHLEQLANHLRLERINVLSAPRDGIYIAGDTPSNTGNLYFNLQQILSEGNGRDGVSIDGGANSGVIIGGRFGGNVRYGLALNDTITGSPTSFPNTISVMGVDLPGNDYGLYEGGHTNRYFGLRFEGNDTGDIFFASKSTGAEFFGTSFSAAPVIAGTPSSRPVFFDKQFFLRFFQENGFLEYYDEALGDIRRAPKRSVYNIPLALTSAATDVINPLAKVQDPIRVKSVTYIPQANITGQNTNYFRMTVRVLKIGGGDSLVANVDFTLGTDATALVSKELTINASEQDRILGDVLYVRKEVIGTGLISPVAGIQVEYEGR